MWLDSRWGNSAWWFRLGGVFDNRGRDESLVKYQLLKGWKTVSSFFQIPSLSATDLVNISHQDMLIERHPFFTVTLLKLHYPHLTYRTPPKRDAPGCPPSIRPYRWKTRWMDRARTWIATARFRRQSSENLHFRKCPDQFLQIGWRDGNDIKI